MRKRKKGADLTLAVPLPAPNPAAPSLDKDTYRQTYREIEILQTADNPFIIRCHSFNDNSDHTKLLLEFMDGGSLEGHRISAPCPSRPASAIRGSLAPQSQDSCHAPKPLETASSNFRDFISRCSRLHSSCNTPSSLSLLQHPFTMLLASFHHD